MNEQTTIEKKFITPKGQLQEDGEKAVAESSGGGAALKKADTKAKIFIKEMDRARTSLLGFFEEDKISEDYVKQKLGELSDRISVYSKELVDLGLLTKEDADQVLLNLQNYSIFAGLDRDALIEKIIDVASSLFKAKAENFELAEQKERADFHKASGFIELDKEGIFSYGIGGDTLHIHLAPARTVNGEDLGRIFLDDLEKLATIIKNNENVKVVTATSPVLNKEIKGLGTGQFLLSSLGFVEASLDEHDIERWKNNEHMADVKKMNISREKFLELYGKQ